MNKTIKADVEVEGRVVGTIQLSIADSTDARAKKIIESRFPELAGKSYSLNFDKYKIHG